MTDADELAAILRGVLEPREMNYVLVCWGEDGRGMTVTSDVPKEVAVACLRQAACQVSEYSLPDHVPRVQ